MIGIAGKQININKKTEIKPAQANAKIKKLGASDETSTPVVVEYIKLQEQNDDKIILRLRKVLWFYIWRTIKNTNKSRWHIANYDAKNKVINIKI